MLAALALVVASLVTSASNQAFQRIASVAVPSINTTNDATALLSAQVSNTAEYILNSQPNGTNTPNSPNSGFISTASSATRESLQQTLKNQRADYDQKLQNGYQALVTYRNDVRPSVDAALKSLSRDYATLQESLAQARGLADRGQNEEATSTYLVGQNAYYGRAISDLYYLRSIHVSRLEDAEREASSSAAVLQYLAIGTTIVFTLALLAVNVWLSLRVKRVLLPLVNLAAIGLIAYSLVLALAFANSRADLSSIVNSYKTTTLLSDAQLDLTDAGADQIKWVIGGSKGAGSGSQFVGDPLYEQDFKTKTVRLLAVQQGTNDPVANPKLLVACGTNPPTGYSLTGVLSDACPAIKADPTQLGLQRQFVESYKIWLSNDADFRSQITAGNLAGGLDTRAKTGSPTYTKMLEQLNSLKARNVAEYTRHNEASINTLGLLSSLNWIIYPVALLLAGTGVLLWRREF